MNRSAERYVVIGLQVILVGSVASLWEASARFGWVDNELLPPLSEVIVMTGTLLQQSSTLANIWITFVQVAVSFLLVVPLGLSIGFVIGERPTLYHMLQAPLQFMMAIPKAIFLPIFIIAFGIGFIQKVTFATMLAAFVLIQSGIAAVHSVPQGLITAARALGATPTQIYMRIYLPAMLPLILSGVRLGLVFAIFGVLLAEMYGSANGLGREIFAWGEIFRMRELFACVFMVFVVTIVLNELLRHAERRALQRQGEAS